MLYEVITNPGSLKVFFYFIVSKLLGLTFGLKLMERGEEGAQINYSAITEHVPEAQRILEDEKKHEDELLSLIDEERLNYVGSIVLGLNDALVELTGTLAGLTFALQNTKLIALAGLITGIAASRITSYNVCYTKLLRQGPPFFDRLSYQVSPISPPARLYI